MTGCGVNNIPTYEQSAKAAWSEVLNQYKRRTDLFRTSSSSVKGFADQEKSVLTEVTEARKQATNIQLPPDILTNPDAMKKFQDAQATLGGALGRLMAVVERYPDIKSGQNFLALQSELSGTENRIAIARRDYIQSVRAYNTEITTSRAAGGKRSSIRKPRKWRHSISRRKSRRCRRSISASRNAEARLTSAGTLR